MINELNSEFVKNSKGELSSIRHYFMDSDDEASSLPSDAPIGSDAISKTSVYLKFSDGWSSI